MEKAIKLNIGAGDTQIPGFVAIDSNLAPPYNDALQLPFNDNSVAEIYSSHTLEHIHHSLTEKAVGEWVRVLKPGGRIRIAVPDFEKVLESYRLGQMQPQTLASWLHGTHDRDNDRHRAVLTKEHLADIMRRAGLDDLQTFQPEYQDCTTDSIAGPMSLNLQGFKREVKIPREPKVAMVISVPRVGFTDPYKSIADACTELGWLFYPRGGTEWGKGMEAACQGMIENLPVDYIVCLDYDSAFEVDDLRKLLAFMQARPDVLAAWPAEMHRHLDLPLGMNPHGAAQGVYGEEDPDGFVRMWSGHFGCTIIRRQVFETLPHPWFWSLPDPVTGDWKNGSDADVTFWRSMHNFGMKFGQLNPVMIGHAELCYKWPAVDANGNARVIWQPVQNYRANGRPKDAVFSFSAWVERSRKTLNVPAPASVPAIPPPRLPGFTLEHVTAPAPMHPPHAITDSPELNEERERLLNGVQTVAGV